MTKFNKLSSLWKLTVAAVLVTQVTACVKADKGNLDFKPQGRQTTFEVRGTGREGGLSKLDLKGFDPNLIRTGNIRAERVADVSLISKDALYTNRREYSMSLCGLEDMRQGGVILGQRFNVFSELEVSTRDVVVKDGKRQANNQIESDSCIYWTVSVPYAHFAKSVNLDVNFYFVSTQGQPAYIHKKMLINPWDADRGGNPELFDYTRFGLTQQMKDMPWARGYEQIQRALQGDLDALQRKLIVGGVHVQAIDKSRFNNKGTIAEEVTNNTQKNNEHLARIGTPVKALDLQLNVHLTNVFVRVFDSLGKPKDEQLNSGHFQIEAQLLASDSSYEGYHVLTRPMMVSDLQNWKMDEMGIRAVIPFSVTMRPTYGNLKLALRVTPTDLPLRSFEGLYDLGEFTDLAGSKSPSLSLGEFKLQDGNLQFNYNEYLASAKNHSQWKGGFPEQGSNESTLQKGFAKFRFTPLTVKFNRVMPGDTATDRTILYTVNTCVLDNFSYNKVDQGLVFKIVTEDRGKKLEIERATDDNGCLNWYGLISHKFYRRENLINKDSVLTYLGKDDPGAVYKLDYYINPWDEKFGTFANDSRNLPPEYIADIERQQKNAPPTRLLLTDFRYDATGFRYAIDRYMNLTVKKTVLMGLHPVILKYNSIIEGRNGTRDLRDGIYLLKIAMQKDYLDPSARGRAIVKDDAGRFTVKSDESTVEKKQFLTIKEMLVRVLGGRIVTPIEFDVKDLRTLRIRAQMFIQLETIDEMLLRVAALHSQKVKDLKALSVDDVLKLPNYTPALISLTATQDEINSLMNKYKEQMDNSEIQEAIRKLQMQKNTQLEKLKELIAQVDPTTLQAIYNHFDLMAKMNQGADSAEGNLVYSNTNAIVNSLRNQIQSFNAEEFEKSRIDFAKDQGASCKAKQQELIAKNDRETAKLYEPNPAQQPQSPTDEGALCFKALSLEQLYYQPVDNNPYLADLHLKSLFGDSYSLYVQNILPDDLSNPLLPNYDFSALSNEGDELAEGARESVSGLPRRTFIGPVTFVLNGNGSAMRPTDALDEAHCNNTCAMLPIEMDIRANSDEIQRVVKNEQIVRDFSLSPNAAYEKSPYYGSVMHFYQRQVDDLIPMEQGLNYQYLQEMEAFSHMGNLVDQMMLDYTSFAENAAPIKTLNYQCYLKWKADMEEVYRNWRDKTDISKKSSFLEQMRPIGQECFSVSSRILKKDQFILQASNQQAVDNKFVSKEILNKYNLPEVSVDDYRRFSKNGLLAPDLSIDKKINILHRMCFMMRKNLIKNPSTYEKRFWERADKEMGGFNVLGAQFPIRETAIPHMLTQIKNTLNDIESECHGLVETFANDVRKEAQGKSEKEIRAIIMARSLQLPVHIERKIRVLDTSGRYIYKDGKTVNFSVSSNFGLTNSFSVNRGYKVDPLETAEKAIGIAAGVAGITALVVAGAPAAAVIGIGGTIMGATFGVLNFNWGMTDSLSSSNGTSVSEGVTLATQISTLDIELQKWEKCVVVKFDPSFFVQSLHKLQTRNGHQDSYYRPNEDIRGLGNMLCSGEEATQDDLNPGGKVRVRERYYYLTQIFNEGDMQDPQSLANHPWMLTLRGARDFMVFQEALKLPSEETVSWSTGFSLAYDDVTSLITGYSSSRHNDSPKMMVAHAKEIHSSLNLMQKSYSRALPTFPGLYTYSDSMDDEVSDWTATAGQ